MPFNWKTVWLSCGFSEDLAILATSSENGLIIKRGNTKKAKAHEQLHGCVMQIFASLWNWEDICDCCSCLAYVFHCFWVFMLLQIVCAQHLWTSHPTTLTLVQGQLWPPLEKCLNTGKLAAILARLVPSSLCRCTVRWQLFWLGHFLTAELFRLSFVHPLHEASRKKKKKWLGGPGTRSRDHYVVKPAT